MEYASRPLATLPRRSEAGDRWEDSGDGARERRVREVEREGMGCRTDACYWVMGGYSIVQPVLSRRRAVLGGTEVECRQRSKLES